MLVQSNSVVSFRFWGVYGTSTFVSFLIPNPFLWNIVQSINFNMNFCPHLSSLLLFFLTTFRPIFTSGRLQVINYDSRIGMLSLITVSPVITAFHSCCLSHHVFDQVTLWPAIFWQCSPGTIETQRLDPLRHGHRRAIRVGLFCLINPIICSPYLVFHSRVRREKNNKKLPRWGQKSAIKLILRLRSLISKRIPNKDKYSSISNISV